MNKDIMQSIIVTELKQWFKANDETHAHVSAKITDAIFEELLKAPKELKITWANYPHLVGFNRWVSEQTGKDTVIGKVCGDLVCDMNWPFRSNSYEEMKKYLQKTKASKNNMKGFNIMYETYLSETSDFQKELESLGEEEKVKPRGNGKKGGVGSKRAPIKRKARAQ
jgi:uncharacterized protein YozE (UPF0346 family)